MCKRVKINIANNNEINFCKNCSVNINLGNSLSKGVRALRKFYNRESEQRVPRVVLTSLAHNVHALSHN